MYVEDYSERYLIRIINKRPFVLGADIFYPEDKGHCNYPFTSKTVISISNQIFLLRRLGSYRWIKPFTMIIELIS
eukprot:UN04999